MITTYEQAISAINTHTPKSTKPGHYTIDAMRELLAAIGNPQEQLRIVHIAGTSGKTSTAYLIRALLEEAGVKTGLTVSPHIVSIRERVQVGGAPISQEKFTQAAAELLPLIDAAHLKPTYFELMIAFAWWVFVREGVEVAVVETGVGGLRDATNTVTRADKLCVLTDIGLDHTEILGSTLPEIAAQKAGIIQPGNTVVVQPQAAEVMDVFIAAAKKQHADFHIAPHTTRPGLPPFQNRNWRMAVAAYNLLGLPTLSEPQLARAATKLPPGRMETITIRGKKIILDGAHNGQKLRALHQALKARGITKTAVVANLVEAPDSKITEATQALVPFASALIAPRFEVAQDFYNRHSLAPADMAERARQAGIPETYVATDATDALRQLFARPEETIIVTGSFYLVSAIRAALLDAA